MSKIHLDLGEATEMREYAARLVPCNRHFLPAELVTADRDAVTCGNCRAWIAKQPEPEPPHEITSRPAPPPQPWDDRGSDIVARSRAGDDGADRDGWPTLDAALKAWWRARGASLLGSSTRFDGGGGGPKTDHTPAAMSRVGRVLPIDRAVREACSPGHSFFGDEDGRGALRLSPDACFAVVVHYLAGRSASDTAARIAEQLGLDESAVTDRQIGIVWRELRRAVSRDLERRGLLPRRAENRDTHEVKEERMALPAGYDVEGWKEIADELHLSESQARELDRRGELRNIVDSYGGHRVIAKRAELRAFAASRVRARRTG